MEPTNQVRKQQDQSWGLNQRVIKSWLRGVLFIAEGELDVICEGRLGNTQGISDMTASRLQRHIFISYKGTL